MNIIQGKIDCQPAETGYDASRVDWLNHRLQDMVGRKIIHGASYCISHKGKVIAHGAVGRNNAIGQDTSMQPDTVFGIASITKTFTATAIMQLIEDGLIRLDTPVGEILPQFKEEPFNGINLWHLLTHTSGLYPDGGCFPENIKTAWDFIEEAAKSWDVQGEFDWISPAISAGLRVPTGTHWQYASFGFVLLGEIVSRVSGKNAHDYIEERILNPLKLTDTSFYANPEMAKRHFLAREKQREYFDKIISGEINGRDTDGSIWDKIPSTGGGLHSTVYDLVRFGNTFVYNGRFEGARILGRKAVEQMSTVQLHNIPDYCWGAKESDRKYGIGWDMRQGLPYSYSQGTIMHEGAGASSLNVDPKEELVAAWFVPFDVGANGWSAEPLYNVQNIIWSGVM